MTTRLQTQWHVCAISRRSRACGPLSRATRRTGRPEAYRPRSASTPAIKVGRSTESARVQGFDSLGARPLHLAIEVAGGAPAPHAASTPPRRRNTYRWAEFARREPLRAPPDDAPEEGKGVRNHARVATGGRARKHVLGR